MKTVQETWLEIKEAKNLIKKREIDCYLLEQQKRDSNYTTGKQPHIDSCEKKEFLALPNRSKFIGVTNMGRCIRCKLFILKNGFGREVRYVFSLERLGVDEYVVSVK